MLVNNKRRDRKKIFESKTKNKRDKNIKEKILMRLPIIFFLVIIITFIFISLMDVFFWGIIKTESNILTLIYWQVIGILIGIVVFALSKTILNFYIIRIEYLKIIADKWEET